MFNNLNKIDMSTKVENKDNVGNDTIHSVICRMSLSDRHKLMSKWIEEQRIVDDIDLDLLFQLDYEWTKNYEKHRIKVGFSDARIIANNAILKLIYGI